MTNRLRQLTVPRLLHVGTGSLDRADELLTASGFDLSRIAVCSGSGPSRILGQRVLTSFRLAGREVGLHVGLTGELDQAAHLAGTMISDGVTVVAAVGGGRVIDTAKLAAARTDTTFVSVPTAISHDGISSPVASLRHRDGVRRSMPATMPAGIIVDTRVLACAPLRSLRAGVGDLVSNLTALLDWRLAHERGADDFDEFSAMIAETAARSVLDLDDLTTEASLEKLAKGLLMSGLAMAIAGTSRPCSGAEHLISHALDDLLRGGAAMHGEQVALGSLVSATAHGQLRDDLRRCYERLGVPYTPESLGLDRSAVEEALVRAPSMRADRYTVLSELGTSRKDARELLDRTFLRHPVPTA